MTGATNNVMAEDGGDKAPPSDAGKQEEQQTIPVPVSAFPAPPKPGSMVQLKVISIDQNAGVVNTVIMPAESAGGSDGLASEFNEQPS